MDSQALVLGDPDKAILRVQEAPTLAGAVSHAASVKPLLLSEPVARSLIMFMFVLEEVDPL